MTQFEKIKAMSLDELAEYLTEAWDCHECSQHELLSDNPLLKNEKCDMKCKEHCKEWLESEVEE